MAISLVGICAGTKKICGEEPHARRGASIVTLGASVPRYVSAYFRALPCETIVPEDGICPSTKTRRERETPVTELKGQKKIKKTSESAPGTLGSLRSQTWIV